jgi:hypothetical protein
MSLGPTAAGMLVALGLFFLYFGLGFLRLSGLPLLVLGGAFVGAGIVSIALGAIALRGRFR